MQGILSTPWPHDRAPERLHGHRAAALRNSLRPGPSLTTGNLSPKPRTKHSSLPESLGMVAIPSKVQDLLLLEAKMVETQTRPLKGTCSSSHSVAPYPWLHSPRSGLPAAAKTLCLFCALFWGELPETGAFFAIPIASHQSSNQSYLACLVGTGWIFCLQRPGSTDSHRSFSAACLCLSPFCLKEEKQ